MANDTVKLLKECNTGIKMGTSAMNQILPYARSYGLKCALSACLDEHTALGEKTARLLSKEGIEAKDTRPIVKAMSTVKIKTKLMMSGSESTVADLMTDGCDMGIKSLTKNLNAYKRASDEARGIAEDLIAAEERLECKLRDYL
ncbi:MAG: hypothetical protein IKV20_02770 [Clostridia bacterium]|nr:hypothetical protein [Clostridia bacterium]